MIQIEKVAEELFDKIRSRFDAISIGDENAKATLDPEKARFFNFDFIEGGENYGNVTISLVDDQSLKVYFDTDIDARMSKEVKTNWYMFLRNLRKFAKRNLIQSFDIRDITKSGLNLKDLKHANKDADVVSSNEVDAVTESRLYGTSRSSYQQVENVRIIARHKNKIVDETKPGARSRNIECFYVENSLGERFRLPEGTTFNGARTYARHVKNGGAIHDDFGQHITKMISEMNQLKMFVRNMRGRQFEDAETNAMVEAAVDHYGGLHRDLFALRGQRGYSQYKSLWQPEQALTDEVNLDELKDRFTRRVFDERLEGALPIVSRIYSKRRDSISQEFESWANSVLESMEDDEGEFSPFANSLTAKDTDGNYIDGDTEDEALASLFNDHGFAWRFADGVYSFESVEELERAKDIIAEYDPHMEFPEMAVYDTEANAYGAAGFDRELPNNKGVSEGAALDSIKLLAGLAK
jgi:hypothetical protein